MYQKIARKIKLAVLDIIFSRFHGLVRAIENRYALNLEQANVIEHALRLSREPVHTLNFLIGESGFPIKAVWSVVEELAAHQDETWIALSDNFKLVSSKEFRIFIAVRSQLNRKRLVGVDCAFLLEEYLSIPSEELHRTKRISGLLCTLIVLSAPLKDVEQMLSRLDRSISGLTEFQKIRFLSRFQEADLSFFDYWYQKLKVGFSKAGLLKIALIRANLDPCQKNSYQHIEVSFSSLPFLVSDRYRSEIKPIFESLPSQYNFLDARFEREKKKEIQEMILDRLRRRSPLSYIRLGDGECYGFSDGLHVDRRGEERQEHHWWGTTLDSYTRNKLKSNFLHAVEKSDILGVPTVLRLVKDFNPEVKGEYSVNSLLARLLCVMKGVEPFLNNKVIVEDQSNLYLFDDQFIVSLFECAEEVLVVSGIKSELIHQWLPDGQKISCIEIPTHRLLRQDSIGSDVDGLLPSDHEKYLDYIANKAGPGVLVLVSAGFIGKSFVSKAAEQGAVALDIGQILAKEIGLRWGKI